MEYISRSLPMYVYILWIFVFPALIGFATQSIIAFWVFLSIMATSYYLYAKNFYLISKDNKNIYAKNLTNIFAKKYNIPLSSIEKYDIYKSGRRKGLFIQLKNKEIIFIPCYRLCSK